MVFLDICSATELLQLCKLPGRTAAWHRWTGTRSKRSSSSSRHQQAAAAARDNSSMQGLPSPLENNCSRHQQQRKQWTEQNGCLTCLPALPTKASKPLSIAIGSSCSASKLSTLKEHCQTTSRSLVTPFLYCISTFFSFSNTPTSASSVSSMDSSTKEFSLAAQSCSTRRT